jgi:septal ring factor EnvC (AmiA/AmiB activator)
MEKSRGEAPMISDELGMQLHNRATVSEVLTDDEQTQLEDWYAQKDAAEAILLGVFLDQSDPREQLRAQIKDTLAQIQGVIQSIGQVTAENEGLRQEIEVLQQQLASTQSA